MNGDNKWPCLFGIKFCTWAGFIMFIGWYSPSEAKFRWKNVQTFLKYFKPKLKIGKKKKNYDNMDLEFFCSVFVVIDHFLSKNSPAVYWNCREFFYSKFMIDGDMKFPFKIWNSTILPCKQPSMMWISWKKNLWIRLQWNQDLSCQSRELTLKILWFYYAKSD